MIPHPKRTYRGGEDAYFISTAGNAVGVADGVGLWSQEKGINPALYSQTLMQGALERANRVQTSAVELIEAGWNKAIEGKIVGSSTACVAVLDKDRKELDTANLGDSGFLVLRKVNGKLEIVYRSNQLLHYFNCPFQLGYDVDGDYLKFEKPKDADVMKIPVLDNDILVLATDGLFDNIEEADIALILEQNVEKDSTELAKILAESGLAKSLDKSVDSPFAILAKDNNFMWSGGIQDDITVVIGKIYTS
jgi:protein phosphatase PTC7